MKILKILKWTLMALIGIVVIVLGLVYFLPGYDMYVVRSDSMTPTFRAGDFIITVPPGSFLNGKIHLGSVVTFSYDSNRITHRVIAVNGSNLTTKGDANDDPESKPVELSQVTGVYLFKIPFAGYVNRFIRTRTGWFVAIIIPAVLLVGLIVKDIVKEALRADSPVKNKDDPHQPLQKAEKDNKPGVNETEVLKGEKYDTS
jgi:signal peptidase I